MKYSLTYLILTLLFSPIFHYGQTIEKTLIATETPDSLFQKAILCSFDAEGNYCLEIKKEGKEYFLRNDDTLGPFENIHLIASSGGSLQYTFDIYDSLEMEGYYKNEYGTKIYGPLTGTLEHFYTSYTKENAGVRIRSGDSLFYYVNQELVSVISIKENTKIYGNQWVDFAEDGSFIHQEKNGDTYSLYLNNSVKINEGVNSFFRLSINSHGDYIYTKGRVPTKEEKKEFSYIIYLHTKDSVFGPVCRVLDAYLINNGGYFFHGKLAEREFILANSSMHTKLKNVSNIVIKDRQNSIFSYEKKRHKYVNVNGEAFKINYDDIFHPSIDSLGNFAFYGLRDNSLYKYINGREHPEPISRYGMKPEPLYISPKGNSIHIFWTDDSTYLYHDHEILFSGSRKKGNLLVKSFNKRYRKFFDWKKPTNGQSLLYIEADSIGYIAYNASLSKSMMPVTKRSFRLKKLHGEIIAEEFNDDGFFLIQKTCNQSYLININNSIYHEIEDIDHFFARSCIFTGEGLIFFAMQGLSVYQFRITF